MRSSHHAAGMLSAGVTALTLLITPVAYSVFEDLAATEGWHRLRARLRGFKPTPRTAA